MSLAQLAQHLQSQGRGDDKLLVHMTPAEVGGLQSLAMAHGGSLTINPQTGLPEAGFLSSILPTIIGAGVGIATMNPMLGAAAGGAAGMAMNDGSLKAGLMAGLSSYGMGSLGVGLAGAGAAASGAAGAGFGATGLSSAGTAGAVNAFEAALPGMASSVTGAGGAAGVGAMAPMGAMGSGLASAGGALPTASTWDKLRMGVDAIGGQEGGWGQFMKSNMLPIGAAGMGLLNASQSDNTQNTQSTDSAGYIRPFDVNTTVNPSAAYTPGVAGLTRTFTPQEPVPADEWGSTSFADGGIARLADGGRYGDYTYKPESNTNISNRYGTTANTPLFQGDIAGNQPIVQATPQYLTPQNNPSNIFGTAFNPYTPFGFQEFGQNRYGPPRAQTNMPVVDQYNQTIAQQANLEYQGQPTLAAFLSEQRKQLQKAYDEILGRAPDAASQQRYLDQMSQGASIDEIRQQMASNPPPVPSVDPTKDTTPSQTSIPSNLAPVDSPYGQPAATETGAAENRQAVEDAAAAESLRVAEEEAKRRLEQDAADQAAREAQEKVAAEKARIAAEEAARAAQEEAARKAAEEAAARAAQEAAARRAQEEAAERARQEAAQKAAWEAEQRRQAQIAEQQRQAAAAAEAERQRQAQAAAAAEAERQRQAAAAAEAQRQRDAQAEYERQITQALGYNPRASSDGSTYAGAYQTPSEPGRDLGQYYMETLGYNPLAQSGGGAASGGLMPYDLGYASGGGIRSLSNSHLGDYSDGGRLLKGPGDGVSDNIPAVIGDKQPARLADGEFVIPARIVSEIGNGSTDAGAKRLYAMMDRIQKARKKSVGKGKVAVDSKAYKHLPE